MRPFDLEAAKRGDPVQTRDGRKVRIICFDRIHGEYPIVGLITDRLNGQDIISTFSNNGSYCAEINGLPNPRDLVMVPKKRMVYLNIYPDSIFKSITRGFIYDSKETAIREGSSPTGFQGLTGEPIAFEIEE